MINDLITVVCLDDQEMILSGLVKQLEDDPAIQVIGKASDENQAINLCKRLKPQILLLDLFLGAVYGLSVLPQLKDSPTKIIMLTSSDSPAVIEKCFESGAVGYVSKSSQFQVVLQAIKTVSRGDIFIDPVMDQALASLKILQSPIFADITARETEVLQLLVCGKSNQEMADELKVSKSTVDKNLTSVFSKLKVASRTEAVIAAKDMGF